MDTSLTRGWCYDEPVEPTDDPNWWKTTRDCDTTCHRPIHGFNQKRMRHMVEAILVTKEPR